VDARPGLPNLVEPRRDKANNNRVMALRLEEDEFLKVAVAAVPRIAEIIAAFRAEDRAGALVLAERRYMQAARDFGCTEVAAEGWVAAVMRSLRASANVL
jgi:hypothetical protein